MRREILFILTALLLVNLINAQQQSLGTFKADGCINLIQTCGSCTYNIITSVQSPNSTTLLFNQSMNKNGTEYTYTFCNTSDLGIYIVNGVGDLDGEEIVWVYDFEITATGKDLTSAKATSYVLIFIIAIIIFTGFLLMGLYLPSGNKRDEFTGYILAVSNLKYLKLIFLCLAYLTALFISYFSWMVSYAYLDMGFVTDILRFIFTTMAILVLPLFILFCYFTIANLVRDAKVGEYISRGLSIR